MEEQKKSLTWEDMDVIAEILYEQNPDVSPAQISNEDIRQKVIKIDEFSDLQPPEVSELYVSAISTRWVGLRHGVKSPEDWYQNWNIKDVCP